jgi:hypothetical protein
VYLELAILLVDLFLSYYYFIEKASINEKAEEPKD